MRSRLFITLTRIATRQLQNPAVQKALSSVAAAAAERLTHNSIEKLRRLERRLRSYDDVVECQWWETPNEKPRKLVE